MAEVLRENSKYIQWMMYLAAAVLLYLWLQPLVAEKAANIVVQRTINGVFLGGIYAIIALGIVVINKASGVFNFAHGGMMMISGYIFFAFFSTNLITFFPAIILAGAAILMVLTTATWRPLPRQLVIVESVAFAIFVVLSIFVLGEIVPGENLPFVKTAIGGLGLLTTIGFLVVVFFWQLLDRIPTLIGAIVTTLVLAFLMTFDPDAGLTVAGFEITSLSWVNALVGAAVGTVLIGLIIERFTIRPLIGQPIFAAVMVTLALAEVLSGFTTLIWGTQPVALTIFGQPNAFTGGFARITQPIVLDTTALLGDVVNIDQPRLFAFIVAIMAFAVFFLFFRFTNIGLAMRATSEDQQLAESVGLRVRVILAVTWGVSSVLAGIAGIMQVGSSDSNALATELQFVALRAFPAVLLGGLESIGGALVGGLILGLTEEWAKLLFNSEIATDLAPYVVLMIILVIRPEGLFGEKRIERI